MKRSMMIMMCLGLVSCASTSTRERLSRGLAEDGKHMPSSGVAQGGPAINIFTY